MKEVLNFLRDLAGIILVIAGAAGVICIFWYFMFAYQSKEHVHEKDLQAVQLEHYKQVAAQKKTEEVTGRKKQLFGKVIDRFVDIGQKLIGL
jgi:hypothetical protein